MYRFDSRRVEIRAGRIHDNGWYGVSVEPKGVVVDESSELSAQARGDWDLEPGGRMLRLQAVPQDVPSGSAEPDR
jgi:hypothetical protein